MFLPFLFTSTQLYAILVQREMAGYSAAGMLSTLRCSVALPYVVARIVSNFKRQPWRAADPTPKPWPSRRASCFTFCYTESSSPEDVTPRREAMLGCMPSKSFNKKAEVDDGPGNRLKRSRPRLVLQSTGRRKIKFLTKCGWPRRPAADPWKTGLLQKDSSWKTFKVEDQVGRKRRPEEKLRNSLVL